MKGCQRAGVPGSLAKPGGARPAGAPAQPMTRGRAPGSMWERKQVGTAPGWWGSMPPLRTIFFFFAFLFSVLSSGRSAENATKSTAICRSLAGWGPLCMTSTKPTGFLSAPQQIRGSTPYQQSILDSPVPDWLGNAGTWILVRSAGTKKYFVWKPREPSECNGTCSGLPDGLCCSCQAPDKENFARASRHKKSRAVQQGSRCPAPATGSLQG